MLQRLRQRVATRSDEQPVTIGEKSESPSLTRTRLFRLGRAIYGGILIITAVDGLRNAQERAQYAAAKDVPKPRLSNYLSHGLLLGGGIGIALWRVPVLATSAAATFLLAVTPQMHDFWSFDDPEQRQQEQIQFLKNAGLFGTALALLGVARQNE